MSTRWGHLLGAALLALPLAAAGCGSDDHPNEPRPPSPIEVTANIVNNEVEVAPAEFGAGLVNLTISNQSDHVASLTIEGDKLNTSSDSIQPSAVGVFKVNFPEGEYEVTAGPESDARATLVKVGPERPSSQNQLLLP
jgi:hypothetical protein